MEKVKTVTKITMLFNVPEFIKKKQHSLTRNLDYKEEQKKQEKEKKEEEEKKEYPKHILIIIKKLLEEDIDIYDIAKTYNISINDLFDYINYELEAVDKDKYYKMKTKLNKDIYKKNRK